MRLQPIIGLVDINALLLAAGKQLRARRRELGLTQARLAAMTGLSRASINGLESGSMDLGLTKVLNIAQVMSMDLLFDKHDAKADWLAKAAASASVSYKKALPPMEIAQVAKTGHVPAEYLPQIATLLDEASPALLARALHEVFPEGVPKSAWNNLAKAGKSLGSSRSYL